MILIAELTTNAYRYFTCYVSKNSFKDSQHPPNHILTRNSTDARTI